MCDSVGGGVGGSTGNSMGKGSQDRYVGKSGIESLGLSGSGGLGTFGVGGSGCVGVGGPGVVELKSSGVGGSESSGIGGEAVTEGHVGRIVSRFEVMALNFVQSHDHGSSVAIDNDVDDIFK